MNQPILNSILMELLRRHIPVELRLDDQERITYVVNGFYKSGEVVLVSVDDDDDYLLSRSRYGEEIGIFDWDDMVRLNYDWWIHSRDRHDGWKEPNSKWINEFVRLGLVAIETKTVTEVKVV